LSDISQVIKTEIAIIKSDAVAIRTLNSLSDPEYFAFSGMHRTSGLIPQDAAVVTPQQQKVVDRLELQTAVKQVDETQLVNVAFRNRNPITAALIVNHLVAAYAVQNFTSRDDSVAQLRTWLTAQMGTLKNEVDTSQSKLATFQEQNSIIGTDGTSNTITDRLRFLNDRLAMAQADRITKEAQLRAAKTGDPGALAALYPNPRLQALEGEQGTLFTQYAQLSAKFGPKYGPLVEYKKVLNAIHGEITDSVQSVQHQLQQEYETALATQKMLQDQYNDQAARAYALNHSQAEYAALQSEVTSNRELYDTLRHKLQQAGIDAEVSGVNTMLVESARVPSRPIAPKKTLVIAGGAIIGLFAGIASAFLVESTSGKLRSLNLIEKQLGYPVLATIPRELASTKPKLLGNSRSRHIIEPLGSLITITQPRSRTSEAYRSLRNAILLSPQRETIKSVLIATALPEEGIDEVTVNFALILAQTGFRVLVVDADLRCPSLHRHFGIENQPGLSDHLLGTPTSKLITQPTKDLRNLYLLTAGKEVLPHCESVASESFKASLRIWEDQFDFIILKSAPLLVVSDSLPLASWVDAVMLSVCYENADSRTLNVVQTMLRRTDIQIAGVIVNDVPDGETHLGGHEQSTEAYYV
jgi:succinoglycan biosynthesis transport protein ExoP